MVLSRLSMYAWYLLHQVDEHSLQGPFAYEFATKVIKGKSEADFSSLRKLREALRNDRREISYQTFGITSSLSKKSRRKVSSISRHGISSHKKSALLYRIIHHFQYKNIVELGASLGINACYMAMAAPDGKVSTIEGHEEIATIAANTFQIAGLQNIDLVRGNIDEVLPALLSETQEVNFAFIDANHHSEALNRYFEHFIPKMSPNGALAIDDIRWSRDMWQGWKYLISHEKVSHSFDLGDIGIMFFKDTRPARHTVLNY